MDALLESGETEKLLPIVDKALSDIGTDDIRREFSRLSAVLKARSCDAAVPSAGASVGESVPSGGSWRKAEVWKGERIIDRPVVLNRRNIKILPGSRLVFKDNGRLDVRQGQFRADGVTFAGEGVLTNAWRISVSGGKIEILNSRFNGLFTHNPGGERWFHGGVCLSSSSIRVAGCRFENTQSLTIVNSPRAEVCDSTFSCADEGVYFLNSSYPRVERNMFDGKNGGKKGIELGGSVHAEIVHNRFDGLALGVYARTGSSYGILCGNAFDSCKRRLSVVESKGTAVIGE
jgi:nitrous oxidase accessory protein NosD